MVPHPFIRFLSAVFLVLFLTQQSGIFGLEGDAEEDFIDVMDKLDRVEEGQDPDKIKEEIILKRNESMKTDGRWNAKEMQCSKAHKIFERPATVQIYMGQKDKPAEKGHYEDNMTCHQEFMGDKGCTVEVECQVVDLRLDPLTKACGDEENLRLSDGLEGEWTGCEGKSVIYRPRGKLRDMYLQVKTREDKIFSRDYEGYKCTARCIKGETKAQELPKGREVKVLSNCVCGIAGHDKDRIVGGKDAKFNEFPCGSLINDKYVLTAAHCFDLAGVVAAQIDVLLHAHLLDAKQSKDKKEEAKFGEKGWIKSAGHDLEKLTDEDEETLRYEVDEIINHPLFGVKYDYDVSLLRLNKRVDFANTPQVASICMPDAGIYDKNEYYVPDKIATVVGWGLGHELAGGSTRLLQKLDVPIIDFAVCKGFIKKTPLTDRMYCAGFLEGEKDACKGDSGGPMVQKQPNGQSYQIGIVSWGEGCARKNSPGVYSRMTELVQWIHYHTQDGKYCEKKHEEPKSE